MTARPLDGTRVVDMSSFVAGPTAGRILAELGAEVIRVDPISGAVDGARWPVTDDGVSLYWAGLNQAKKSVTVNLRSDAGREFVTGLVAEAGILLENAAHARWLDNDVLAQRCPDLIHLHIEGHADGTPAVDYSVNAEVGLPLMTGPRGSDSPVNHVLPAWDLLTGLYAALGLVTALRRREQTGEGAYLQLALGDVALSTVASMGWVAEADRRGTGRARQGNALFGSYGADFPTADGRAVMVVGLTAGQWRALVDVTDTADVFAALERHRGLDLSVEADRYAARDTITAVLCPWFESRTLGQIATEFDGTRVLWSPYRTLAEVATDLRHIADEVVVQEVDQPGIGAMLTSRSPLRWSGVYTDAAPAPASGAHTRQIAAAAGLDDAAIDALVDAGVLGDPEAT
ncbi:2-methylfumaryl-CoA isomerase [Prescottella agglutinans]|uniref:2-methylfumaryl-CoA isomerase n=1 Tax=Prescottella agglutinans TaxID=1644129 RepID=A0A3S3E8V8_9NOCA|nr:CoA transferase [Prescottella agglutinans]RVW08003.1 2-methylfumaryl-CoA isomerase [Prescottella agglutinans]